MASVRLALRAAAVSFALLASLSPRASFAGGSPTVYDNQNLHLMGSRAAGMGGAYTALACDEVALHYNPASLACARHSHIELVANAYMVQSLSIPGAYGQGQDIGATTYHSIPSAVGAVYILSEGEEDTGRYRQAFGFLITVPASIALKADPTSPSTRNFLSATVRDDVLAGDLGYGIQVLPKLSLGASLGGAIRILNQSTSVLVTNPIAPNATEFVSLDEDAEALALGLRAKLGARYTPTRALSVGLSVATPSLDVYGSYKSSTNVAYAGFGENGAPVLDAAPVRYTGKSAASFPMKVSAGVAYSGERLTVSGDVSLSLPRDVRQAYDLVPVRVEGVEPTASENTVLSRVLTPNVGLGAEVRVTRGVAVAMGAFTDFSTVKATTSEEDRIHMFGLTGALSLTGSQTRGTFGLSFSYGEASTIVRKGEFSLATISNPATGTSTLSRWNLVGVIGSSYAFLPDDVAAKAMEEKQGKPKPP
ncbi:MAG: hypothetical protein U0183_11910 [Polyangiaceae bacterium]